MDGGRTVFFCLHKLAAEVLGQLLLLQNTSLRDGSQISCSLMWRLPASLGLCGSTTENEICCVN